MGRFGFLYTAGLLKIILGSWWVPEDFSGPMLESKNFAARLSILFLWWSLERLGAVTGFLFHMELSSLPL